MSKRKKLVVFYGIEIVVDFVYGRLRNEYAIAVVPHILAELERLMNDPDIQLVIVWQRDKHESTLEEFLKSDEGKYFPIWHSPEGDPGMELIEQIRDKYQQLAFKIVDKNYIFTPKTAETVGEIAALYGQIDEIRFYGFLTGMCVLGAAIQVRSRFPRFDTKIIVDAKGTADLTPERHWLGLYAMARNFIEIVNWDDRDDSPLLKGKGLWD